MKKFVIFLLIISTFMFSMSSVLARDPDEFANKTESNTKINARCVAYFGDLDDPKDPAYYMRLALDIMQFLGPALVIVMTIIDLIKIAAEQKNDGELQKMGVKTFKRMVFAGILFILPSFLNWLLELVGLIGTCL